MVVVYFLWFYFVCSYHVASGENVKAKAWEKICRRQQHSDKLSTRIHKSFVSTPRIAPIGGMKGRWSLRPNPLNYTVVACINLNNCSCGCSFGRWEKALCEDREQ